MKIVLKNNIFYFNGKFYKQIKGTAMGTKCAPFYATLTLGYLEKKIIQPALHNKLGPMISTYFATHFCRYLDDCFIIWPEEFPPFEHFLQILNDAHPAIKFTSEHSTFFDSIRRHSGNS